VSTIAHERPAERATEPVLAERRFIRCKEITRVEGLVTSEVERCAAWLIGAAARGDADDGIQGVAVLRVELVAEDFELLHRVLTNVDRRTSPLGIIDVAAIDEGGVSRFVDRRVHRTS
jgi:hypothetical protein